MRAQVIIIDAQTVGVRIPRNLMKQCGLENGVVLTAVENGLLLTPVRPVRQGWEEAVEKQGDPCGPGSKDTMEEVRCLPNHFDGHEWK